MAKKKPAPKPRCSRCKNVLRDGWTEPLCECCAAQDPLF